MLTLKSGGEEAVDPGHGTCAECHDHIARTNGVRQPLDRFFQRLNSSRAGAAVLLNPAEQAVVVNTWNRFLTGGIDWKNQGLTGGCEAATEIVEVVGDPAEAMGLEDRDDPMAGEGLPGGLQRGLDLNGVMAVVVDQGDRW